MKDLEKLLRNLKKLGQAEVTVESPGTYKNKYQTPIADVHRYQNDGTTRGVTPAQYVERAEKASDHWSEEIGEGMDAMLETGSEAALRKAADEMAQDISDTCDRVRTRTLKESFRGKVTSK